MTVNKSLFSFVLHTLPETAAGVFAPALKTVHLGLEFDERIGTERGVDLAGLHAFPARRFPLSRAESHAFMQLANAVSPSEFVR
jgi:hypothetical protein